MRFTLLAITIVAAAGSVVAAPFELLASPMPIPVRVVTAVSVFLIWFSYRLEANIRRYLATPLSLVAAVWSVVDVFALNQHGVVSHSLVFQALAFTAFAGFAAMAPPTAEAKPPTRLRRQVMAAIPVVVLGLGLWGLLAMLNPVSMSRLPEGALQEAVTMGEVQLRLYDDGISATTPEGTWSYTHRGAKNVSWPNQNSSQSPLVTSPNQAYVAAGFVLEQPDNSRSEPEYVAQEVVVFETKTGKPVIKVFTSTFVNVQLTNSAALIGRDAYSLETGEMLWHSDAVPLGMLSMSGTPERFIADARCVSDVDHLVSCELDLINAADGSPLGTVSALGDAYAAADTRQAEDVLVVEGWALDRAFEPVEAPQINAEAFTISAHMVARNLDTGETVSIGPGAGLDSSAGKLGIRPPSPSTEWNSGNEESTATSWFDPKTKQVQR